MSAYRLYIDNSVLNRPFDDHRQPRIWLETLAFSLILSMIENGEVEMLTSVVQALENEASTQSMRRRWVEKCLRLGSRRIEVNEVIRLRAYALESLGIKPLDALHASSAEAGGATHFLTCDDELVKKYRGPMLVMNPQNFVMVTGS